MMFRDENEKAHAYAAAASRIFAALCQGDLIRGDLIEDYKHGPFAQACAERLIAPMPVAPLPVMEVEEPGPRHESQEIGRPSGENLAVEKEIGRGE